jgi:hypothetical protein
MSDTHETTARGCAQYGGVVALAAAGLTTGSPELAVERGDAVLRGIGRTSNVVLPFAETADALRAARRHDDGERIRSLEQLARVYLDMGFVPVAYGPWGERIITKENVAWVFRKPVTAAEPREVARKQRQTDGGRR